MIALSAKAEGSYQHSIAASNWVEQATDRSCPLRCTVPRFACAAARRWRLAPALVAGDDETTDPGVGS